MWTITDYEYRALAATSQVRLLKLLPSEDWSDELRGELGISTLHRELEYEAVSYTWGGVKQEDSINIEGSKLQIPRGCSNTLRRLRGSHNARVLWIDAICINQRDIQERNDQVEQMPRIYSGAGQVLAYIGESDPGSEWLFRQIRESAGGDARKFTTHRELRQPANGSRKFVEDFFNRPWFYRIWVVQEIMLARDIVMICGQDECGWDDFLRVLSTWEVDESLVNHYPAVLRLHRRTSSDTKGSLSPPNILSLLQAVRSCLASDDRDKVFGVRGLLPDCQGRPDVRYDLTTGQVFERFARQHIEATQNLDVLCYAQRTLNDSSWIPDWRVPGHRAIIAEQSAMVECSNAYCAGGQLRSCEFVQDSSKGLTGLRVQSIILAAFTQCEDGPPLDSPSRIRSRYRKQETLGGGVRAREPLEAIDLHNLRMKARANSVARNRPEPSQTDVHHAARSQPRLTWGPALSEQISMLFDGPHLKLASPSATYHRMCQARQAVQQLSRRSKHLLMRRYAGRFKQKSFAHRTGAGQEPSMSKSAPRGSRRHYDLHPFVDPTESSTQQEERSASSVDHSSSIEGLKHMWLAGFGRSLVPEETRVGDIACILLGAPTPFVLRPREKHYLVTGPRCQQYQIVGECYVEGAMYGEILKVAKEQENVVPGQSQQNVDFVIRDIAIL